MATPTRPLSLLLITATVIFLLEGLIMLVLHLAAGWVGALPIWVGGVLDAVVLSVTVFPLLYVLWFQPLSAELHRRQQAEAALRRSHEELEGLVRQRTQELAKTSELFRATVQTARDAIISANSCQQITAWNLGAERLFGYPAEAAVGQPLTLIIPERFRRAHAAGFERFLAGGEARIVGRTMELVGLRQDGQEFPLELSLTMWRVEAEMFFTAIIRDIAQRKAAETALKQERDALEAMNRVMLDREERILALKRETNDLLQELNRAPRYPA